MMEITSFSEVLKGLTLCMVYKTSIFLKLLKLMLIFCIVFAIVLYFSGLVSFCIKRKHLLLMLLSLEFIILGLYFNVYLFLLYFNFEFYFRIVFLTMRVCEGTLGLSILVSLIRTHGNDYFQTFSVLW